MSLHPDDSSLQKDFLSLAVYLESRQCGHVLLMGKSSLVKEIADHAPRSFVIKVLSNVAEAAEWANAVNSDPPASLPAVAILNIDACAATFEQALGDATRQFPHWLICHTDNSGLADSVFFALGFRRLTQVSSATSVSMRFFEYQMGDYKPAPSWLNARYWANPERFDLEDDPDEFCDDDGEE